MADRAKIAILFVVKALKVRTERNLLAAFICVLLSAPRRRTVFAAQICARIGLF
jgi:hypothetical protein